VWAEFVFEMVTCVVAVRTKFSFGLEEGEAE
jgi:hypothetical protein